MKKPVHVIIGIVVVVFALVFAKNLIAKSAVSTGVRVMTGLKLGMKSLNVGVVRSLVEIKGLKLYNPEGFPERLMVDMPEIYVDYDLGAFLKKKVHLEEVRLNLKEFIVVKNQQGELNLDSLKSIEGAKKSGAKKPSQRGKAPEIQIDTLELKIGKVVYKDFSGGRSSVREFNVNINERYKNITDPQSLANLIVVKALMNTSISSLANFDLGTVAGGLEDTLGTATKLIQDTGSTAIKAGKEITGTAKEATEKTTGIIKDILPFGKK